MWKTVPPCSRVTADSIEKYSFRSGNDVRGRKALGDRSKTAHVGEQDRSGDPRLADAVAGPGRAAAGPELMQFDEVPGRVRQEEPARTGSEPAMYDPVGHGKAVEFRLRLVDRSDSERQVRRRKIEFARGQRVLRGACDQVDLGEGAGIDALALAGTVPGHVVALESEDLAVETKRRARGIRTRGDTHREMMQFRDLERHDPAWGSKISTERSTRRSSPGARPPTPITLRASSAPPASRMTTTTEYSPGPSAEARANCPEILSATWLACSGCSPRLDSKRR